MQDWQERWEEFTATRAPPAKRRSRARAHRAARAPTDLSAAQRERLQGELSQLTTTEIDAPRNAAGGAGTNPRFRARGQPAARGHEEVQRLRERERELVAADDRADSNCRTRKDA